MNFGVPVVAVAAVLVQQPGNGDNGGQGEDFGKSSPVGLLLLIVFFVAVALLVRSMTKHLKRVPASFDDEESETRARAGGTPESDTTEQEKQLEPSESSEDSVISRPES